MFIGTLNFRKSLSLLLAFQFILPPLSTRANEPTASVPRVENILSLYSNGVLPNLESATGQQSFMLYLKSHFRGKTDAVDLSRIKITHDILTGNPELAKPDLKRVIWKEVRVSYGIPQSSRETLEAITKAAGRWKALLLNPQANIGDWLKLKIDSKTFVNERLFEKIASESVLAVLGKKDRTNQEVLEAYAAALKLVREELGEKGYFRLWSGLIHLLAATDPEIQAALKSPDGLVAVGGIKAFLARRDELSQAQLKISFNDLSPANDIEKGPIPSQLALQSKVEAIEKSTRELALSTTANERIIRSLSIAESGFRSCLADDCATRNYFSKAFDPNFIYFTLQEGEEAWKGAIAVVLGTARSRTGEKKKTAFVDKIQGFEDADLPGMLEGVRRIFEDFGYELVIPNNLGAHNGISNTASTRAIVKTLPGYTRQSVRYYRFKPHPAPYDFPNMYSRAYKKLGVRPLLALESIDSQQFALVESPKNEVESILDETSLWQLIEMTFPLKNGSLNERLRYIGVNEMLDKNNLPTDPELYQVIDQWLKDRSQNIKLRFRAMTFLLRRSDTFIENYLSSFSDTELKNLVQNWAQKEELNTLATKKNVFWRVFAHAGPNVVPLKSIWTDTLLSPETWALFKDGPTLQRISRRVQLVREHDSLREQSPDTFQIAISFLIVMEAYRSAVERNMAKSAKELEDRLIPRLEGLLEYCYDRNVLPALVATAIQDPDSPADEAVFTKLIIERINALETKNFKSKIRKYAGTGPLVYFIGVYLHMLFLGGRPPIPDYLIYEMVSGFVGLFGGIFLMATAESGYVRVRRKQLIEKLNDLWKKDLLVAKQRLSDFFTSAKDKPEVQIPTLPPPDESLWVSIKSKFGLRTSPDDDHKLIYLRANHYNLEEGRPTDPEFDSFVLAAAKDSSKSDLQDAAIKHFVHNDNKKLDSVFASLTDANLNSVLTGLLSGSSRTRTLAIDSNTFWKLYANAEESVPFKTETLRGDPISQPAASIFLDPSTQQRIHGRIKQMMAMAGTFGETKAFGHAMEFVVLTEALKTAIDKNLPLSADILESRANASLDSMLDALESIQTKGRQLFAQLFVKAIQDERSPVEEVLLAKSLDRKLKSLGRKNARIKAFSYRTALPIAGISFVSMFASMFYTGPDNDVTWTMCSFAAAMASTMVSGVAGQSDKSLALLRRYKTLKEVWSAQSKELKKLSKKKGDCACLSAS